MKIAENIPLSTLTTMRLGGPARYVIDIEKPSEIKEAYDFASKNHLPYYILGGGANTIARDKGFNGAIFRTTIAGITASNTEGYTIVTAGAGEPWDNVVKFTTDLGLTGCEALSKIPGLTGAAPVQNIGAYGQELADTFASAEVYDFKDQAFKTLTKSDFGFSYRKSILNTTAKNRYLVISITLRLKKGEMSRPFYNSIEKYIEEHNIIEFSPKSIRDIVSKIRADKLPDPADKPSAGSFFKNIYLTKEQADEATKKGYPVYHGHDGYKINSGWLIDQAGFNGKLLHGIRVNKKASLVLINESAKSYKDLALARQEIIDKVKQQFGYTLEQEPNEI